MSKLSPNEQAAKHPEAAVAAGQMLRQIRTGAGVSLRELARAASIEDVRLANIERGVEACTFDMARHLGVALAVVTHRHAHAIANKED